MSYGSQALGLIVKVAFDLLITILLLRVMLQLVRANFFNPICQFLVKLTNPILAPLRKIIPNWGRLDLGAVLVIIVLQILAIYALLALGGRSAPLPAVSTLAISELLDRIIMIWLVTVVVRVLLSWFAPAAPSPVTPLLYQLTEPIMSPVQRIMPPLGGIDLSPLIVLLLLQVARILLVMPIRDLAQTML